ncbi:MAG TPA: beta-ketoacyl-[acyl-carrier-protein] synthase family protein [Usitatibacter sp.]|nr:beta-ketoacyl-[acyl-carrier-protein] synthase family protein [Usitatibacter sp.]
MNPLHLSAYTVTSCLGRGLAPTRMALRSAASGLKPCDFETVDLATFVGEIEGVDAHRIPARLARFDCRNNRAGDLGLVQDGFIAAVEAAIARHGAGRIGVFMGTSTAGILQTEQAYRRRAAGDGALPEDFDYRHTHNTFSIAEYVRARLGLEGPCSAISTACSSSAKAFATAARLIHAGFIDAAVVGGVDTLCLTTLYGFNSLQLLSAEPCRPYDTARDGISIGEAAAFALLERARDDAPEGAIALLGSGESCDAHHMSAPHPEGLGARLAMEAALAASGLEARAIDYVNLHGTGTPSNDAAEDKAVHGLFGERVACSSTKGLTGHALGAAGAVEALLAVLALEDQHVPGSPGTRTVDPQLRANYQVKGSPQPLARVMSNSFGFGGSNCSLVFGRLQHAR